MSEDKEADSTESEEEQEEKSQDAPAPAKAEAPPMPELEAYIPPKKQGFIGKLFSGKLFSGKNRFVKEGEGFLRKHDYEQATIAFQTALKGDPKCTDAYIGLADVLGKKGGINNFKAAVNMLHKATEIDPFKIRIYDLAYEMYDKLGKKKEAMAEKRKQQIIRTLKTNPNDSVANNNLGVILLRQNKINMAIEYLKKAADNDLSYETGHSNLAKALFQRALKQNDKAEKLKDLDTAGKCLERVLRLGGESPFTLVMMAKILILKESYEEALQLCNRAIAIDNTMKEAYAAKKLIFERTANLAEAGNAYKSYKSLSDAEKKPRG